MDFEAQVWRVALAFGIGLVIGLERGWSTRAAVAGTRTAGVRTFAFLVCWQDCLELWREVRPAACRYQSVSAAGPTRDQRESFQSSWICFVKTAGVAR
jgi:hypothetical protein